MAPPQPGQGDSGLTPPLKIMFVPYPAGVVCVCALFRRNRHPAPITELPWFGGSEAQRGALPALPALF